MPDDNDRNPFNRKSGGDNSGGPGVPRPRTSSWLAIVLVALIGVFLLQSLFQNANTNKISYSDFQSAVTDGKIDPDTPVKISDSSISGALKQSDGTTKNFTTALSTNVTIDQAYTDWLQQHGVNYEFVQPSIFGQLLINILPFVLIMGLLYWFVFRRMNAAGAGALNMGKNKVKIYDRKEMKTTFADVAGVDEAKDELREIVEFLSNPKKYQRLGGRIPKGVLLLGPPGCGKTLLARAVAGEANVPFFFMSGSEFVEMFVGLGAARQRGAELLAEKESPALVAV